MTTIPWRRRFFFKLLRFYPPYLGAGVRLTYLAPDLSLIDVAMPLRFWNRNAVGTHFGGSLASMCDPFYMLILLERLGRDYLVWDKAASIRFRRPGTGWVRARFEVPEEMLDEIRDAVARDGKVEPVFSVDVLDEEGRVVAEVTKTLWIKRKDPAREDPAV